MLPDYYWILGVPEDASSTEIRTAYRELMREFHPDRNRSAAAEEGSKQFNAAYEVLGNPAARRTYDERLRRERDELARRENEQANRTAHPFTKPPASSPSRAQPPAWAQSPPPPPQAAPPPSREPHHPPARGMRSGRTVVAVLVAVAVLVIGSSFLDVPATTVGSDDSQATPASPHPATQLSALLESTTTPFTESAILPPVAPTVVMPGVAPESFTPAVASTHFVATAAPTRVKPHELAQTIIAKARTPVAGPTETLTAHERASTAVGAPRPATSG